MLYFRQKYGEDVHGFMDYLCKMIGTILKLIFIALFISKDADLSILCESKCHLKVYHAGIVSYCL